MSQPYKICPICRTPAHRNAAVCSTCGATLSDVNEATEPIRPVNLKEAYDHRYGETDLYEGELSRKGNLYLLGGLVTLGVVACIGVVFFIAPRFPGVFGGLSGVQATLTPVPTRNASVAPAATNTPRPTLQLATVTPAPPTPTASPTEGPCMREVQPNDTLLSLAYSCGHRSLDIVNLIVEINELDAPESIQIGQVIEIPWPTPTLDPNLLPTEELEAGDGEADAAALDPNRTLAPVEEALMASNAIATETLQPGIAWHRVQPNENIIGIAFAYGADVEILDQLNPEITFSQCDYSSPTGGPNCIVQIYAGQLIRVPAPTPTPTIPPTPSGSETATPTLTPTYNAPSAISPGDRSLFRRGDLITLRWVATGTLAQGQTYRVRMEDITADAVYTADTREIYFIVPEAWQGQDSRRHDYRWTVSVIDTDDPDNPYFTTEARLFSWEGRGVTP